MAFSCVVGVLRSVLQDVLQIVLQDVLQMIIKMGDGLEMRRGLGLMGRDEAEGGKK